MPEGWPEAPALYTDSWISNQGPRACGDRAPSGGTILVVDDSSVLRGILKEELEAEGFEVQSASEGTRGLELVRDQRPDIVLLDVGLPELDGYEVCRRIKQDAELVEIPVLMLSGRNELKDKLAGYEAGADDYMTKPFFTRELVARIRCHLRSRESLTASRKLGQFYLEMLFGIGSTITSPFPVDDDLEIILRQTMRAAGVGRGAILLLDRAAGSLEVRKTHGYNGEGPRVGDRVRVSDKLAVADLEQSQGPLSIRMYQDDRHQRAFIPMVAKEVLIGGIEIELDDRAVRFSANEQKLLYALASQAAIFIENARLERDVRSMFLNIIVSMAGAVDARDAYTHGHSLRVARMSLIIARRRGMSREEMEPLLLSAILHDVGKIAIADDILKKPTKLSPEEFEIMMSHTVIGAKMLSHIAALEHVIPGIRQHHECWDGRGYPDGLKAEEISLIGRIIHIADAFDAMTTNRTYRKKVGVRQAMREIVKNGGTQFDPQCVALLETAFEHGEVGNDLPDKTPTIHELIDQIQ